MGGLALTLGGLAKGVRDIRPDDIPQAALLAAVFFTASLIHINIGPGISAHLILSGLIGLLLGWAAFPVIFAGLLLQGLLLQFGGLTVLGVNTFNMAGPAVLLGWAVRRPLGGSGWRTASVCGLICGGGAVLLSGLLVALSLRLTGREFQAAVYGVILANLPVVVIESVVTMFCVQFLRKVRPEMLRRPAVGRAAGRAALRP
jgi:cobalt/nickel transport system permease protein